MRKNNSSPDSPARPDGGFTLMELMVVIGILTILIAIAFPNFLRWRQNLEYQQAARNIVASLRDARGRAISFNRQNKIDIDVANRRIRPQQGDRQTNSSIWTPVYAPPQDWIIMPPPVNLNCNVKEIRFGPNGSATYDIAGMAQGNITILDDIKTPRYVVNVLPTGRITMSLQH